jgi:DNA-binding transcriptional LysR family regulator
VQRRVASFDNKDVGPVRVTCLVTVGQRIVKSGLLDAFHERHPGMVVELLMEQRMLDLSKGEADIAIRGGTPGPGALVGRKIAELPWGIYASRAFIERHGRPAEPRDIQRFAVVELIDELKNLPAVRWMSLHASQARIAARCANVPSVHLAVKSGAGLAPLPAVHAAADADLVSVLGTIPELNYPIFLASTACSTVWPAPPSSWPSWPRAGARGASGRVSAPGPATFRLPITADRSAHRGRRPSCAFRRWAKRSTAPAAACR